MGETFYCDLYRFIAACDALAEALARPAIESRDAVSSRAVSGDVANQVATQIGEIAGQMAGMRADLHNAVLNDTHEATNRF